jgi:uncharacterized protein (DUF2344 family)
MKCIETPTSWKDVRFEINPIYSIRSIWNKSDYIVHLIMLEEMAKPKPQRKKIEKLDSSKEMFCVIRTKELGERFPKELTKELKFEDAIRMANKMYSINNK